MDMAARVLPLRGDMHTYNVNGRCIDSAACSAVCRRRKSIARFVLKRGGGSKKRMQIAAEDGGKAEEGKGGK